MHHRIFFRLLSLLIALSGFAGHAHAGMHEQGPMSASEHAVEAGGQAHAHPDAPEQDGHGSSLETDCCQLTLCTTASALLHGTSLMFLATADCATLSSARTITGLHYPPPVRPPR
ncbi:MAG: hypothetical protein ACI9DC_001589 [Gammaproteobacteria bacterium]|jgi:hypothetical protein